MKKAAIILLLVTIFSAPTIFAQGPDGPGGGNGVQRHVAFLADKLSLTSAQQTQVTTILNPAEANGTTVPRQHESGARHPEHCRTSERLRRHGASRKRNRQPYCAKRPWPARSRTLRSSSFSRPTSAPNMRRCSGHVAAVDRRGRGGRRRCR